MNAMRAISAFALSSAIVTAFAVRDCFHGSDSVMGQGLQRARRHGALASVVVEAVDENGNPVADADVDVYFYVLDKQPNRKTGKTDSSGRFTAAANATWEVRCFVRKDGFYEGIGRHYLQYNLTSKSVVGGRWQPWNQLVRVHMLQKGCPVSFFRKWEWNLKLPESEKTFGYDFDVGSLVAPNGKGLVPHVFFTLSSSSKQEGNENPSFLNVAFPGEGSGIVPGRRDRGSSAELPRRAPDNGYCPSTNLFHYTPGPARGQQINDDNNECFFVFRTKEPGGGQKMIGPVMVSCMWTPLVLNEKQSSSGTESARNRTIRIWKVSDGEQT